MAAACGAAAEVPGNGAKPGTEVVMRFAAAMSGFCLTVPPDEEKFPGVIGEPSGLKKMRRGPSELKVSTGFFAPTTNALVKDALATSTAATLNASTADEWPFVLPAVLVPR